MQEITAQILALLQEWGDLAPPQINNGICADFATILWERFRAHGMRIVSDEDMDGREYTHTFVEYGGRYYDAECPYGVSNWKELPIFTRQQADTKEG